MVFHWSRSDSMSLPVSWTLLRILADRSSAVVWMVSPHPPISIIIIIIIITIIIIIIPCKFFASVLANGFSLESEWQEIFSGLQDFSLYYGWFQICYSLVNYFHYYYKVFPMTYWPPCQCTQNWIYVL